MLYTFEKHEEYIVYKFEPSQTNQDLLEFKKFMNEVGNQKQNILILDFSAILRPNQQERGIIHTINSQCNLLKKFTGYILNPDEFEQKGNYLESEYSLKAKSVGKALVLLRKMEFEHRFHSEKLK